MGTRHRRLQTAFVVLLTASAALACNLTGRTAGPVEPPAATDTQPPPPTEPGSVEVVTPETTVEPEATPTPIVHTNIPSDPPAAARYMTDRSSLALAAEGRSIADDFNNGVFERPFSSQAMEYKAYLDLTRGEIAASGLWLYTTLSLEGSPIASEPAFYGVEIDTDIDGRGNWLIYGSAPSDTQWTTDGVKVYEDRNNDVGAMTPVKADPPPQVGDQYETLVFDEGVGPDPDAAWIRRSPANPNHIQIAIRSGLIAGDNEFLWGVWAFSDPQPGWIDYQDHFTLQQAGSPLSESPSYPLAELALVDNSCRWAFDFTPVGNEPGLCRVPPTPTPVPIGSIAGTVTHLGGGFAGGTVLLGQGGCPSSGYKSTGISGGSYKFTGLAAGTYCVTVDTSSLNPSAPYGWKPVNPDFPINADPYRTVNLAADEQKTGVNFSYYDVPG